MAAARRRRSVAAHPSATPRLRTHRLHVECASLRGINSAYVDYAPGRAAASRPIPPMTSHRPSSTQASNRHTARDTFVDQATGQQGQRSTPVDESTGVAHLKNDLPGFEVPTRRRAHPHPDPDVTGGGADDPTPEHKPLGEPNEGFIAHRTRVAVHNGRLNDNTAPRTALKAELTRRTDGTQQPPEGRGAAPAAPLIDQPGTTAPAHRGNVRLRLGQLTIHMALSTLQVWN